MAESGTTAADLGSLTVPKLKERCRELGIAVGGKKAELIQRILAKIASDGVREGLGIVSSPATPKQATAAGRKRKAPEKGGASKRRGKEKSLKATGGAGGVGTNGMGDNGGDNGRGENNGGLGFSTAVGGGTFDSGRDSEGGGNAGLGQTAPTATGTILYPRGVSGKDTVNSGVAAVEKTVGLPPTLNNSPLDSRSDFGRHLMDPGVTLPAQTPPTVSPPKSATQQSRPKITTPNTKFPQKDQVRKTPTGDVERDKQSMGKRKEIPQRSIEGVASSRKAGGSNSTGVEKITGNVFRGLATKPRQMENSFRGLSIGMSSGTVSDGLTGNDCGSSVEKVMLKRKESTSMGIRHGPGEELMKLNRSALGKKSAFKGLKPNLSGQVGSTVLSRNAKSMDKSIEDFTPALYSSVPPQQSQEHIFKLSPKPSPKQDDQIYSTAIRNPPRISMRRKTEKISKVLGLVAFCGTFRHADSSGAPGNFLKLTSALSRDYRYASTLAFTYLVKLEFPGARTERWLSSKRIDEKVADLRAWYWHRVSCRRGIIERVKDWWAERVWRFLALAEAPESRPGNAREYGLWFDGINKDLLAEQECEGSFEIAIRFWIQRFTLWTNGGGSENLLQEFKKERVEVVEPVGGREGNREVWRIETKSRATFFIIGKTGEVIGWNSECPESRKFSWLKRLATRRFIQRGETGTRSRGTTVNRRLEGFDRNATGNLLSTAAPNVSWNDLRGDWERYVSSILANNPGSPKPLMECIYYPGPQTFPHGIHESITLPHHRALAERWILTHVEAGGVSGKPVLENPRSNGKVFLDLESKFTVESVRCEGEKWNRMEGVLAKGVGFVQTPEMGWFVLEETGQEIGTEDYGIQGMWATVLGVDENGRALKEWELEGLGKLFVMDGLMLS
ncbi:hypothetical protein RUND412_003116 [Rhizina undulata]